MYSNTNFYSNCRNPIVNMTTFGFIDHPIYLLLDKLYGYTCPIGLLYIVVWLCIATHNPNVDMTGNYGVNAITISITITIHV